MPWGRAFGIALPGRLLSRRKHASSDPPLGRSPDLSAQVKSDRWPSRHVGMRKRDASRYSSLTTARNKGPE